MTTDAHTSRETDELAIQLVVDAFFGAFASGSGLDERMTALRDLFVPQAVVTVTCGREPAVMGVDAFIEPRHTLLAGDTLTEFSEWSIGGRVDVFGDIAHWFGGYAKAGRRGGEQTRGRGMKSIQLVRTSAGWRITAAAWDDERDGVTLPT